MGFEPHSDTPFRDPAFRAEDGSSNPPPPDLPDFHGDGNDHGCDCGLCGAMPTALEQVCYRDILQVVLESPDGCITRHEFQSVCLSSAVLRALYCELQENGVAVKEILVSGVPLLHAMNLEKAWATQQSCITCVRSHRHSEAVPISRLRGLPISTSVERKKADADISCTSIGTALPWPQLLERCQGASRPSGSCRRYDP